MKDATLRETSCGQRSGCAVPASHSSALAETSIPMPKSGHPGTVDAAGVAVFAACVRLWFGSGCGGTFVLSQHLGDESKRNGEFKAILCCYP